MLFLLCLLSDILSITATHTICATYGGDSMHFGLYSHRLVIKDNQIIERPFIVIRDDNTGAIVQWTNFQDFIVGSTKGKVRRVQSNSSSSCSRIVMLLNYLFFDYYNISKLTDTTVDMLSSFLNDYGMCQLPDDDMNTSRGKDSVSRCISEIIDFFDAMMQSGYKFKFVKNDLYREKVTYSQRKRSKVVTKVPVFRVNYVESGKHIFRDIPEGAFVIIFNDIVEKHTNILMLAALGAFAGLRPSEACNVRRADSVLGPGIRFEMTDGVARNVYIDLTRENDLRSDHIPVGGIKKARTQKVYPAFINVFTECYEKYMKFIDGRKYEADYGALTNTRDGKAMTYSSYYAEFQKVIDECIPVMLASDNPKIVIYGQTLQSNHLAPHIFRHWFSSKLTLYGASIADLQYWRGDSSPESSITYIQNKSDLEAQYNEAVDKIFDYQLWKAGKEHDQSH